MNSSPQYAQALDVFTKFVGGGRGKMAKMGKQEEQTKYGASRWKKAKQSKVTGPHQHLSSRSSSNGSELS